MKTPVTKVSGVFSFALLRQESVSREIRAYQPTIGIGNGQPIQSEERSVQCRCVDHCDTDERVFVPFLTPAPTPFLSPAPAVVPLFVP
jgi:hypothetical protein